MSDSSELVALIAGQVRERFLTESSGHDWQHIHRVWKLARQIVIREGGNQEIAELGALLHDIADWKFHGGDDTVGPREAHRLLSDAGAPPEIIGQVVDIVATISFKGAGVPSVMQTLEGRCVQDADRLDAIGAIGIARCFAYGGHAGRLMYDPAVPPELHQTAAAYKAAKGTSLNHFYEKLFLLRERMNTASGRLLAERRHQFMEEFVARFLDEWAGEADPF